MPTGQAPQRRREIGLLRARLPEYTARAATAAEPAHSVGAGKSAAMATATAVEAAPGLAVVATAAMVASTPAVRLGYR